jgi:hypothetical protein
MPRRQDQPSKAADGQDYQKSVVSASTTHYRASDSDHLLSTSRLLTRNNMIGERDCFYQLSLPTIATPTIVSAKSTTARKGSTPH